MRFAKLLVFVLLLAVLTACGGGGGSGTVDDEGVSRTVALVSEVYSDGVTLTEASSMDVIYDESSRTLTQRYTDDDFSYEYISVYDENDNQLEYSYESLRDDITSIDSSTNTYNSIGKLIKSITKSYYDGELSNIRTLEVTYDSSGNVLSRLTNDVGDYNSDILWTYTYDANSNVIKENYAYNTDNPDGNVFTSETVKTYDSSGNNVTSTYTYDSGDDSDDYTRTSNYTFDASNNCIKTVTSVDYITNDYSDSTTEWNYVLDSAGNQIESTYLNDYNNDGNCDIKNKIIYLYDAAGNLLRRTRNNYENCSDTISSITRFIYTYSSTNKILTQRSEIDSDNDSVIDYSYDLVLEYDSNDYLIKSSLTESSGYYATKEIAIGSLAHEKAISSAAQNLRSYSRITMDLKKIFH